VLPILKPVDKCWQPADFLPKSEGSAFLDEVEELRKRAAALPDDYLVVFAGARAAAAAAAAAGASRLASRRRASQRLPPQQPRSARATLAARPPTHLPRRLPQAT
jgi:hypothetical protein